jgi:hypothetical protein
MTPSPAFPINSLQYRTSSPPKHPDPDLHRLTSFHQIINRTTKDLNGRHPFLQRLINSSPKIILGSANESAQMEI